MAAEDPTQTKTQIIDPEIAKLLGLEDDFDLDYDDYFSLLREKIAQAAFDESSKLSEEDLAKLANERKRIRDLKDSKFTTPPKKTINADSFFGKKSESNQEQSKPITDPSKLLGGSPGAISKKKVEPVDDVDDVDGNKKEDDKVNKLHKFLNDDLLSIVKEIRSLTEDIVNIFKKQSQSNKKGQEKSRIEKGKQKRLGKEDKLEGKKEESKGSKLLEKVTKPFTSIFDTIKNFILMVLLGSAVNWLFSVIKNPKILLQPVQDLIDGIVGVFNNILQFIDKKLIQPVRSFIDSINSAIRGFIDMVNGALKLIPGAPQLPNDPDKGVVPNIPAMPQLQAPDIVGNKDPQPQPQQQGQPQKQTAPAINVRFGGGSIDPVKPKNIPILTKNMGGSITKPKPILLRANSGSIKKPKTPDIGNDTVSIEGGVVNNSTVNTKISGLGPDQYLTALSLGEYVLKPGAVDWLGGEDYLDKVNALFGGRSEKRVASMGDIKIEAMNTGGSVGGGNNPSSSRNDGHKDNKPSTGAGGNGGASASPESSTSVVQEVTKNDPPKNAPTVKTKEGRVLIPDVYAKNTESTKYIVVGKENPKSYTLRYTREGATGNYTVKQINKVVRNNIFTPDSLTGVNPLSPEGQAVINSANTKEYFRSRTAKMVDKIEIKADKDSDLWYWYTRSYTANYNHWRKIGKNHDDSTHLAARAAAEFSVPGKNKEGEGLDLLPGADNPAAAPEALKTVSVDSDAGNITSTSTSTSGTPASNTEAVYNPNFKIEGDAVDERYLQALESGRYVKKLNNNSGGTSDGKGGGSLASNFITGGTSDGKGGGSLDSNFITGGTSGGKDRGSLSSNFITGGTSGGKDRGSLSSNFITGGTSGGMGGGSSILDPTKTGASMRHVFEAAQEARAKARAEGLPPEEVERRVIIASENAKKNGPITPISSTPSQTLLQSIRPTIESSAPSYTLPQPQITPSKTPTIPSTPVSKSSTTIMPIPGGGNQSQTQKNGVTKTGTTPLPSIRSFDDNQRTMVTVAAIYNIWGM